MHILTISPDAGSAACSLSTIGSACTAMQLEPSWPGSCCAGQHQHGPCLGSCRAMRSPSREHSVWLHAPPSPQPCTCTLYTCEWPCHRVSSLSLLPALLLLETPSTPQHSYWCASFLLHADISVCLYRGRPHVPVIVSLPAVPGLGRPEATAPISVVRWALTNPAGAAQLQSMVQPLPIAPILPQLSTGASDPLATASSGGTARARLFCNT